MNWKLLALACAGSSLVSSYALIGYKKRCERYEEVFRLLIGKMEANDLELDEFDYILLNDLGIKIIIHE